MPRRLASSALAVALVAGVVFLLVWRSSSPEVAPEAPLVVRASLDPTQVELGDPLTARVVVLLDRGAVRLETLRLGNSLAPLTELQPGRLQRSSRGRLLSVTLTIHAACLGNACIARVTDTPVRLAPVTVRVASRTGRILQATARWPLLHVRARVTTADLVARRPPLRADTAPPPLTYWIAPGTLAPLLEATAGLLLFSGIALAALEALAFVRRRWLRAEDVDVLTLALRRAREAEARPPTDRRRALAQLARLLDRKHGRLAEAASELAWSEQQPSGDVLAELVAEIEREARP